MKSRLTVDKETFAEMLQGLIASGCIFSAYEIDEHSIEITFTGAY
jgi:hypothetical protein